MPLYEYQCGGCGVFEATRPMAAAQSPCRCPSCGRAAKRILSASPAATASGRGRRRRGSTAPRLATRPSDAPPLARPTNVVSHGRPWMLGH